MARFKKKPIVIESEQFLTHGKTFGEVADFCSRWGIRINGILPEEYAGIAEHRSRPMTEYFNVDFRIGTLENKALTVSEGDWIIRGVEGETDCCKPSIFEKTYERVY